VPCRLVGILLALAASAVILPATAAGQGPTTGEAAAMARLHPAPPAHAAFARTAAPPGAALLPDSAVRRKKDHTVIGLAIGAGLGFAAGWAFYDVICEAVDNRCSDSRVGLVVSGTALGGMLGALVGSLSD
jgi:hypothetical protein